MTPKEEYKIVRQSIRNPNAFGILYDRCYKRIYYFVFKRLQDDDLTADIVSQVFLKALINIKKYKYTGAPFISWLFRIAINEVNSYYRSVKKVIHVPIAEESIREICDEMEDNEEIDFGIMVEGLNQLDDESTQLIDFRFFEKKSFREIGEVYGISEDNAKVRTYRALKKLKNIVKGVRNG
ncbi:MAG: sigma-70 family RNA polymerase sigma factor [Flavobacteriales bacterium]|nr:sigma-70 family RNA polymerase sigma factor [Flavobacteriales bacterium]